MRVNQLILYTFIICCFLRCDLETFSKGKKDYERYCASCHMVDGTGLAALIPPIAESDYYAMNQDKIACMIVNGINDSMYVNGVLFQGIMEPINLSPVQITNIINYMNTSWGNNIPLKSIQEVQQELNDCYQ